MLSALSPNIGEGRSNGFQRQSRTNVVAFSLSSLSPLIHWQPSLRFAFTSRRRRIMAAFLSSRPRSTIPLKNLLLSWSARGQLQYPFSTGTESAASAAPATKMETPASTTSASTTPASTSSSSETAASSSLHSSDIAHKPNTMGWGYEPTFGQGWDRIFAASAASSTPAPTQTKPSASAENNPSTKSSSTSEDLAGLKQQIMSLPKESRRLLLEECLRDIQ
eukprot:NODE_4435_length_808_cov_13.670619_g4101_i0.p1 GENE.NODE_4435_length_808_cov_13.670619_g4101_i0~~NODE_4435_length_808_cov_13.670619_g4101_i0.p1  ORF type:complete len:221 (+),score=24.70 NODE_4435_length_808_cov_13.670619_g4101_i0:90-752(+)